MYYIVTSLHVVTLGLTLGLPNKGTGRRRPSIEVEDPGPLGAARDHVAARACGEEPHEVLRLGEHLTNRTHRSVGSVGAPAESTNPKPVTVTGPKPPEPDTWPDVAGGAEAADALRGAPVPLGSRPGETGRPNNRRSVRGFHEIYMRLSKTLGGRQRVPS